jgi:hypothetical protein
MKRLRLGFIIAAGLTLPAFGEEAIKLPDGIYQLNLVKSTFHGPIGDKSQTFNVVGDAITTIGISADDKPYIFTGINGFADGKPHPVTGITLWDTVTQTPLDRYTISISRSKNGKVVNTAIRVWNPEAKTMWLTMTAADGSYSHVLVYDKQ